MDWFQLIAGVAGGALGGGTLGTLIIHWLSRGRTRAEAGKAHAEGQVTISDAAMRMLTAATSRLEDVEDKYADLERKYDEIRRSFLDQEQRIKELRGENDCYKLQEQRLKSEVARLEIRNRELTRKVGVLQDKVATLEKTQQHRIEEGRR